MPAAAGSEAVIGRFQHVMLALDQVAADVQALRGGDIAGLLEVAHDQAGQQAQAERMVAVRRARRFDLSVRAPDALGVEEPHRVGGLHLLEFLLAAASQLLPSRVSSAWGRSRVVNSTLACSPGIVTTARRNGSANGEIHSRSEARRE